MFRDYPMFFHFLNITMILFLSDKTVKFLSEEPLSSFIFTYC